MKNTTPSSISVGIVGGSGYAGLELIRLLAQHPAVSIEVLTSREHAGKALSAIFPHFDVGIHFSDPKTANLTSCAVVFFATPHGLAMTHAPSLLQQGVKVIDLSADFRLTDPNQFQHWYGVQHHAPELLTQAVYGLPEYHRHAIKNAQLVANPGCYPTAMLLALKPLLEHKLIDTKSIVIDAKSGSSGAGRSARSDLLFADIAENFRAYSVSGHRHIGETEQELSRLAGYPVGIEFIPHLLPMARGMLATVYVDLVQDFSTALWEQYAQSYSAETFVRVLPLGQVAETRYARNTNQCVISLHPQRNPRRLVLCSVIDNLGKGAAAQALQNFNLMMGLPESLGLQQRPSLP